MITVTDAAKDQIDKSRAESNTPDLPLRIAIQVQQDGKFHYQMGFDDNINSTDTKVDGTNIVIGQGTQPIADGMTIDFVEIDGKMEFIFINPNDPTQQALTEK